MIDVSKCKFEESSDYGEMEYMVYFFTYPKEHADDFNVRFQPFDSYDGDVVSLCVGLTDFGEGEFGLEVSPTVANEDSLIDCDWHYVDDYDDDTVDMLLRKANEWRNGVRK